MHLSGRFCGVVRADHGSPGRHVRAQVEMSGVLGARV